MPKEHKTDINSLLEDKSFNNWAKNTNQNDITYWNTWIENNPEHLTNIYTARDIIVGVTFNKTPISNTKLNTELEKILQKIDQKETLNKPIKKINYTKVAGIAASIVLLMFFAINFQFSNKEIVHKTSYGEVIDLKLPDGTSVHLNGNSEISYNKDTPRKVFLKGEGYFKVQSKTASKAKFWVKTKDLTVEVYGTEFNINNRENQTNVVLDKGSINLVLNNGEHKAMSPGDIVSYSNANNTYTYKKTSKSEPYSSWKANTFLFNKTSLKLVMKYIEDTYGLEPIFVDKDLQNRVMTGGIPNKNIDICIDAIQKSINIKIEKQENKLLISTQ